MRWLDGITYSMDTSLTCSGTWWWTGKPGVLQSMRQQRVGHNWATEMNWLYGINKCNTNKIQNINVLSSVQLLSQVQLQHARLPCPSPTPRACSNSHIHRVSDAIQPSYPLLSPSPPAFNLSQDHSLFQGSFLHIRWPKYWSFSLSISPSNEYSGIISFRMDWFDLAVQGTLKSLLQHHSSKAPILQHSAFFIVQLSHPHMTTGKTIALTRWTFVSKVMSLLFNTLSWLVPTFLPKNKRLLISWLQTPSAVIWEPPKSKVSHCFHCFPTYLPWHNETRCHDLSFLNVEF